MAAAKRQCVESPQLLGVRTWQERDAAARARAIDLTDSPVAPVDLSRADSPVAAVDDGHDHEGAAALAEMDDDDPVLVVGERSWRERDTAARAAAVDVEEASQSTPPVAASEAVDTG